MDDRETARRQEANAFGLSDDATWQEIYDVAQSQSGLYLKTRRNAWLSVAGCFVALVSANIALAMFLPVAPIVLTVFLAIYSMTGVAPEPWLAATYAFVAGACLHSLQSEWMPIYYLLSLTPAVTAWFVYAMILALALPARSHEKYFDGDAPEEIRAIHREQTPNPTPRKSNQPWAGDRR